MVEVKECLEIWSRATYLAQLELAQDNVAAAKEFYIDALNASIAMRQTDPIFYAQTQVALASVCLMVDDSISAVAFLCDVLPIYEKYYGRVHVKMVELYHLIACVHHHYGLLVDAKLWYESCLECMGLLGIEGGDKLTMLENFAALLQQTERESEGTGRRLSVRAKRSGAELDYAPGSSTRAASEWDTELLAADTRAEGTGSAGIGEDDAQAQFSWAEEDQADNRWEECALAQVTSDRLLVDVLIDAADDWSAEHGFTGSVISAVEAEPEPQSESEPAVELNSVVEKRSHAFRSDTNTQAA